MVAVRVRIMVTVGRNPTRNANTPNWIVENRPYRTVDMESGRRQLRVIVYKVYIP